MENTLKHINKLVEEGIILKYAIGEGIACLYYIQPTATFDLDIMIIIHSETNILTPLESIYQWAKKNNFAEKDEHIIIEGVPVQFLPVYKELINEAVKNANNITLYNTSTYIIKPEYLFAIMLDTFRTKDKFRALQLYEELELDKELLNKIIDKYNLKDKFELLLNMAKS